MASNPIADLIMQLLREGPQRGLPMVESPGLSRYLNDVEIGKSPGGGRRAPNVSEIAHHPDYLPAGQLPDNLTYDSNGWPVGTSRWSKPPLEGEPSPIDPLDMPPPISRDPWFDEIPNAPSSDDLFLWGVKNGNRVRLDGPFKTREEAQRALMRMQKNVDPRTGFRLEIDVSTDL